MGVMVSPLPLRIAPTFKEIVVNNHQRNNLQIGHAHGVHVWFSSHKRYNGWGEQITGNGNYYPPVWLPAPSIGVLWLLAFLISPEPIKRATKAVLPTFNAWKTAKASMVGWFVKPYRSESLVAYTPHHDHVHHTKQRTK